MISFQKSIMNTSLVKDSVTLAPGGCCCCCTCCCCCSTININCSNGVTNNSQQ
ncbi:streptolysin S family bacteriocin [Clostridium frigidicarnis]|uniref:Bacteriocin protoxin, streptolysin S family n=1 Tax=Clostridium frigidicarnis TaxID=84698 RepID=A0A1I0V0J5_9CLOT|nr:streptolysin S family bacteriocin [Clostridium frigidicarnis]SFA69782.1 bacteriocin protoxin, streptolysin S family [Clostridium frigidicarnis]